MQVTIGQKIKELRKRDGRKQEDLAKALGVTSQAVSRWEANGCYPDMGMIPAIANYFHITIDELFGYNNDRNNKLLTPDPDINSPYSCGGFCEWLNGCSQCHFHRNCYKMYEAEARPHNVCNIQFSRCCGYECC